MHKHMNRRTFGRTVGLAAAAGMMTGGSARGATKADAPAPDVIREPARTVPVADDVDVCVLGGSCTGVFAAVAAARLGAKVAIVERQGFLGGTATASMVNVWHSLRDWEGKAQIIAGLTAEVIDRLEARDAVIHRGDKSVGVYFNCEELKLELDRLLTEAGVRPFLHTQFAAPVAEGGRMLAALVEDKSGRRAILAKAFVDATGDADAVTRMGLPTYKRPDVQPPTTCAVLRGTRGLAREHGFNLNKVIFDKQYPEALEKGFSWSASVPGGNDEVMLAGTRVFGADCSDPDQLTRAEMDGRRQVRRICDLLREHFMGGKGVPLLALPARIGIRETRHARCLHALTGEEVVQGTRFPDAVANGSYRVDVHSARGAGVRFEGLKGPFYQVPYRSLVPRGSANVLVAGRSLDADARAFGAVRVMVNCNQMGQAAGVACWHALDAGAGVAEVDVAKVRDALRRQGAIVL
ncbi:MAG: FAD-dependent oxidoreductase [Planctomycetota bacterium]|nr:FAD-dependent oxidoreductase [Planctomycetota bacterium]